MILFLAMSGAIWFVGSYMKAPKRDRWAMIALLYALVLAGLWFLPEAHPMRRVLGEGFGMWVLAGIAAGVIYLYRALVGRLRSYAARSGLPAEAKAEAEQPTFNADELQRYARHLTLRDIGGSGQKRLKEAKVLLIGAGGLGAPCLMYLGAAGIGTLGVVDDDVVSLSNLQRQIAHRDEDIGTAKVFSAQQSVLALNPHVSVRPYMRRLTAEIAAELFADYDVILDGSDTYETRALVSAAAAACGVPVVSGAVSQWEGQVTVFDPARGAPCFACLFPQAPSGGAAQTCSDVGVIGPLTGVIGSMMALEAIKVLLDIGTPLRGEMLIYDGLYAESRRISVAPRSGCKQGCIQS